MGNEEKGIPKFWDRSLVNLCETAKTRVRVESELSDGSTVKVAMRQGSMLSSIIFAVVVDVVTEMAREGV